MSPRIAQFVSHLLHQRIILQPKADNMFALLRKLSNISSYLIRIGTKNIPSHMLVSLMEDLDSILRAKKASKMVAA